MSEEEEIKISVSENEMFFVTELIDLYREDINNTIIKVLNELIKLEKRLGYYLTGIDLFEKREAFKAKRFSSTELIELIEKSGEINFVSGEILGILTNIFKVCYPKEWKKREEQCQSEKDDNSHTYY